MIDILHVDDHTIQYDVVMSRSSIRWLDRSYSHVFVSSFYLVERVDRDELRDERDELLLLYELERLERERLTK